MSISDAMINDYGEVALRACFSRCATETQKFSLFKAILKRDAPRLARSMKWGGPKNSFNHLMAKLNETN